MLQAIEYLPWDSDFFGYAVGEIKSTDTLKIDLERASTKGFRLLYARSQDKATDQIFTALGGKLVDEKVTFFSVVSEKKAALYPNTKLYTQANVSEELYGLALQSGHYSRFKTDSHFQNNEFEKLYTAWIENAVKKEIAERVIIAVSEEKTIGLLTLGIKNERADIGILAVDENFRGQGIGKQLLYKAFAESKSLSQSHIQVVTQQANLKACQFYKKLGFEIEKIENIYHFWLD